MYKNEEYFKSIADHFENLKIEDLKEETLIQIKRSLANYLAAMIYSAGHGSSQKIVDFIAATNKAEGNSTIWGEEIKTSASIAAFANAARVSSMELNDSTKGSAHPGIYIWSSLLAAYEEENYQIDTLIKSVVFGFELSTRMALLSIERVIELGLHNPGIIGGLGASCALGYARGLSKDELYNAFSITGSLLPTCPFISFIEGADVKDFYGGWGVNIAFMAVDATSKGLSGPSNILNGEKSLVKIFRGEEGKEIELGKPYYIDAMNIKEYPACFAVNPAVNAIKKLLKTKTIDIGKIERIKLDSYAYSVELSSGVKVLNPTSARLSLPYTSAYVLTRGDLTPNAFLKESLENEELIELSRKIEVHLEEDFGRGTKASRAARISLKMASGIEYTSHYDSEDKVYLSDDFLKERLMSFGEGLLNDNELDDLWQSAMNIEKNGSIDKILLIMNKVKRMS